MRFRAAGAAPPTVLLLALMISMAFPLGTEVVPVGSVPRKFPAIVLPSDCSIRISAPLFPGMMKGPFITRPRITEPPLPGLRWSA